MSSKDSTHWRHPRFNWWSDFTSWSNLRWIAWRLQHPSLYYIVLFYVLTLKLNPCFCHMKQNWTNPKKTTLTEPLSIIITQANLPTPQSTNQCNFDSSNVSQFKATSNLCESRGGFHGGRNFNRGGGRFGGRFIVQCQICFKHGHGGSICYHRHSSMMPPMWKGIAHKLACFHATKMSRLKENIGMWLRLA